MQREGAVTRQAFYCQGQPCGAEIRGSRETALAPCLAEASQSGHDVQEECNTCRKLRLTECIYITNLCHCITWADKVLVSDRLHEESQLS